MLDSRPHRATQDVEDIRDAMTYHQVRVLHGHPHRVRSQPQTPLQRVSEGTGNGILQEVERWLAGERERCMSWPNGLTGTGESTIAQKFAETSFAEG